MQSKIKGFFKSLNMRNLFSNNKFIAVFSVLIAFISWIVVSIMNTENIPVIISDIPVSITLSDSALSDNLRIFSGQDSTASVTVVGNRIVVGQLTKDDVKITAQQTNVITMPGNYTLALTAKKAGLLSDYEIMSDVSPGFVNITVDRYKEIEFNIEDNIKYTATDEYYKGNITFSSPSVVVSGSEKEIAKISRIVAEKEFTEPLKQTTTETIPLVIYDKDNKVINSNDISLSINKVDITIVVLLKKMLPVSADFSNVPPGLDIGKLEASVIPNRLEIAASEDTFSSMPQIKLNAIDFSSIDTSSSSFDIPINLPVGCKNISEISTAKVTINMKTFAQKVVTLNNFSFINNNDTNIKSYTNSIKVTVVGPVEQVLRVSSKNLEAQIDMSGKDDFKGYTEIVPTIIIKDYKSCWIYGKYKVLIGKT